MVDIDLKSDEEKAEELKAWWKANGVSVIAGVALAIAGMFGWQQWQKYQVTQKEEASRLFAELNKPETTNPRDIFNKLSSDYSSSNYASLAALGAAKASCLSGKTEQCIKELQSASKSSQDSISSIAKLRLARVFISTGKVDQANKILAEKMPAAYESLISELKGDVFFAKKDFTKARAAYDRAILSSGGRNTEGLKLKRDDLGDNLKTGA